MSNNSHWVTAPPSSAEPCESEPTGPRKNALAVWRQAESTHERHDDRLDEPNEGVDGRASFFDPDLDNPLGDSGTCRLKSPFGHHIIVNAESIEFFICIFDEATALHIPPDFERRPVTTAAPEFAPEFMVRRRRVKDLTNLLEQSQPACEHILVSEHPLVMDLLAHVQTVARAANVKHAANTVLAEIDAEAGRS